MKNHSRKVHTNNPPTLAELLDIVTKLTHNERLSALIVADMINSRQVRLGGPYEGRRVLVS